MTETAHSNQRWLSKDSFVSHYNFNPEVRESFQNLPSKVRLHDITLRDGEQQAGIVFRKEDKIRIAGALDEAGVDRIEAGLPSVSPMETEAVREIAHLGLEAEVFAFARCMRSDVDLAMKCDVDGVMMEVPSSDHLIEYAYGWDEQRSIDTSVDATAYAHEHGIKVTFFTIDSTRASFETFWRLVASVAERGHMDALTLVDTFGVSSPEAIAFFVSKVRERLKDIPLEIHAHNDFGLAVANTLAAVRSGVETVHVTVNGIGERCGNAPLEEVAMTLKLLYGVETSLDYSKLHPLSKLVEELSRVNVPPQKAVVGDGIYTTESGIIAGWWARLEELGMPLEMFPFLPSTVGHPGVRVIMGKKSGRDSVTYKARQLGLALPLEFIDEILRQVKTKAEKQKRALTDDEFIAIVSNVKKKK